MANDVRTGLLTEILEAKEDIRAEMKQMLRDKLNNLEREFSTFAQMQRTEAYNAGKRAKKVDTKLAELSSVNARQDKAIEQQRGIEESLADVRTGLLTLILEAKEDIRAEMKQMLREEGDRRLLDLEGVRSLVHSSRPAPRSTSRRSGCRVRRTHLRIPSLGGR